MSRSLLKFKPVSARHEGRLVSEHQGHRDEPGEVETQEHPDFFQNLMAMISAGVIVTWGLIIGLYETTQIESELALLAIIALTIATIPWIYVTIDKSEIQSRSAYRIAMLQCAVGAGAFVVYATYLDSAATESLLPWTLTAGEVVFTVVGYTFSVPTLAKIYEMYYDWTELRRPANPA